MIRIDILSIFPELFAPVFDASIIGNAQKKRLELHYHDIREFTTNKHRSVDDEPYGGGGGMVMMVEPVVKALEMVLESVSQKNYAKTRILLAAADGKVYNQQLANELAKEEHLIVVCGHYKGIDERISHWIDERISVGDYVLSGGEIPAMIIVDSIARLLPGVVSDFESVRTDSHYEGLLGAPAFTRPREFRGHEVPEVLLSGHHKKIEEYRFLESWKRTREVRPDIVERTNLTKDQRKILKKYEQD